jgi:hypothetical protein
MKGRPGTKFDAAAQVRRTKPFGAFDPDRAEPSLDDLQYDEAIDQVLIRQKGAGVRIALGDIGHRHQLAHIFELFRRDFSVLIVGRDVAQFLLRQNGTTHHLNLLHKDSKDRSLLFQLFRHLLNGGRISAGGSLGWSGCSFWTGGGAPERPDGSMGGKPTCPKTISAVNTTKQTTNHKARAEGRPLKPELATAHKLPAVLQSRATPLFMVLHEEGRASSP